MFRFEIICCLFLLIPVGCNKNSGVVHYEVDREPDKVLTTELLRDQFDPIPFSWDVPAEWVDIHRAIGRNLPVRASRAR